MPSLRKRSFQARSGLRNVTLKKFVTTSAFCGRPSMKSYGQLCMIKLVLLSVISDQIEKFNFFNDTVKFVYGQRLWKVRYQNHFKTGAVFVSICALFNYRISDDVINDNLECLIVEISKPRSSVFLVGTWYRPPNSLPERFDEFENVIDEIDVENKELYIYLVMLTAFCCQRLLLKIPHI